jgi:hypothetical protein
VIWQETFDDLPNGTTTDAGPTAWTAYQTGLKAGGIWSVDNGSLLARNVVNNAYGRTITVNGITYTGLNSNFVVWESELIDITAAGPAGVRIFVEISSATTAELEDNDYVRLMYRIDGGAWQDFAINSFQNDDFGRLISASLCSGGNAGSTVQLRFEVANTTVNEFYRFDNITVVNASDPAITLPGITHRSNVASGNWNAGTTWDTGTVPGAASVVEVTCGSVVQLSDNRSVRAVVVQPGGALVWTANNVTLTFTNGTNNALVINTGGGLGESIGGIGGVANSRIIVSGDGNDFPITNNSSIVDIDIFRIEGTKNVSLDGIGTFEMRELAYITGNQTFTNRSTLVTDNISRTAGNPVFTNDTGGLLRLRGTGDNAINANVVLNASATGNTVSYMRNGNQNIFKPSGNTYFNLIFDGTSGTKTTNANFSGATTETITVLGDLTIRGAAVLNVDTGNDNLALHGNWTNSSTAGDPFVQGAETVLLVGNGNQTVTRTAGTETFANLVVNKPGGQVNLGSAVDIAGTATFTQGIVNSTTTHLLTFLAGSAATGASNASHVDGPVRKVGNTAFTFPTGDDGVLGQLGIPATDHVADAFQAQYFRTTPTDPTNFEAPLTSVSTLEYWTLQQTANGGAADAIAPTLHWQNGVASGLTDLLDVTPAIYAAAGWETLQNGGTTGTIAGSGSVAAVTTTNFALGQRFLTFGSLATPLPIVLTSFTAAPLGSTQALLRWQATATETTLLGFWIERSLDGTRFEARAFQPATSTDSYTYTDERPATQAYSYYRLQALGADGSQQQSAVRVVRWHDNSPAGWQVRVYPNPASTQGPLQAAFELDQATHVQAILLDVTGRQVWQHARQLPPGAHVLGLPSAQLAAGTYYLQVVAGAHSASQRIQVLP